VTDEELEEARQKYVGKLVRILEDGEPLDTDDTIGVVERVTPSVAGIRAINLRLRISDGDIEQWYIDAHGYSAEIYTH